MIGHSDDQNLDNSCYGNPFTQRNFAEVLQYNLTLPIVYNA